MPRMPARVLVLAGLQFWLAGVQSLPADGVPAAGGVPGPPGSRSGSPADHLARSRSQELLSRGFDSPSQFREDVRDLCAFRPLESSQLYYISTVGSTYTRLWDLESWDAHISIWRYGSLSCLVRSRAQAQRRARSEQRCKDSV